MERLAYTEMVACVPTTLTGLLTVASYINERHALRDLILDESMALDFIETVADCLAGSRPAN